MSTDAGRLEALAAVLDEAVSTATPVSQISAGPHGGITLVQAYAVQAAGIRLRTARGEQVVGAKLGFTSKAKAEQMGVSDVIAGVLTDAMQVDDDGTLEMGALIHPRIEPEIAFRLAQDGVEVAVALEIIDSRYQDFRFDLQDVVADNTSAARFVVGPWQPLAQVSAALDLADLPVTLRIDGETVAAGSSADILGDPVAALPAIERMAATHGLSLPAGSVVLAGAATAAVPLPANVVVEAQVSGLGVVRLTTTGVHT